MQRLYVFAYGDRNLLGVLDLIKLKAITYTIDEDDVIWIIKGDEYHGS